MRRFPRLLAVAVLALSVAACASRASQDAVRYYNSGDYVAAKRAAEEGTAADQRDRDAWRMRVRAELALGSDKLAATYAGYYQSVGQHDTALLRELATATLRQAIQANVADVRVAAITVIEAAELEALAEQVATALDDETPKVAATAAVALINSAPGAAQQAQAYLTADDPQLRKIALAGIARKVGAPAAGDYVPRLTDSEAAIRRLAVRALGDTKDVTYADAIKATLTDSDDGVRGAAASALAKLGAGDLAGIARQLAVRDGIATQLGAIELAKAAGADDLLRTLTAHENPTVALAAAVAMANRQPDVLAAVFTRTLGHANFATRAGALNVASAAVGKPQAVAVYVQALQDPHPMVRLTAARLALFASRDATVRASALDVLRAALTHAELDIMLDAAGGLAEAGDQAGVAALDRAASNPALPDGARVAVIGAHRSAAVITPGLVAMLADKNALVRVQAAAALLP